MSYMLCKPAMRLIERLEEAQWYSRVGVPLNDQDPPSKDVLQVRSWKEAAACGGSLEWENVTLEQQNAFSLHVGQHYPERMQRWNEIAEAIRQHLIPLAESKIRPILKQHNLPDVILHDARWCLLGAVREIEYVAESNSRFFRDMADWYLAGRYPCGWGKKSWRGIKLIGPPPEERLHPSNPDMIKNYLNWPIISRERAIQLPSGSLIVY